MNNTIGIVNDKATVLEDDQWILVSESNCCQPADFQIVPFKRWLMWEETESLPRLSKLGVVLQPDDEPCLLLHSMDAIALIALTFPNFRDGRAYSQANLLRTRYGFTGELRAVGDVLRDQLAAMRHCGFSSFTVREDKSTDDALKGLTGFDMIYARSVTHPEPLFRRRR